VYSYITPSEYPQKRLLQKRE